MEASSSIGFAQLKDASNYKTTSLFEPVKLRLGTEGAAAYPPISIPELLQRTVNEFGNRAAFASRSDTGLWNYVSYKDYQDKSLHVAKAFIKLGLEARRSVGILAFNCPEWFIANMGVIHANGISVGIYTTNSSNAIFHILENSQANIVVVDDEKQMAKILEIRHKLPLLRVAIQINDPLDDSLKEEDGYYKWSTIEGMIVSDHEAELEKRLNDIAINECCSVVYTSGTTGMPKGVMLSHDNITWDSRISSEGISAGGVLKEGKETMVSYLPLSHVAALNGDIYLAVTLANTTYFGDRNALKGSLVKTLSEVRPTIFGAVPRVYEKMQEKLLQIESQAGYLKRSLLNWAKSCAWDHRMEIMKGNNYESFQYRLAKLLVLNQIKRAMGLDHCKCFFSGAAPLSIETRKFFIELDIQIQEIYGLSENFGGHSMAKVETPSLESVGKGLPGTETEIYNPNIHGHGEVCFRGRHVFMGYADELEKTNEALDNDGWLHTGDIGYLDDDGYLYITGRLKELIITAGGENIPPARVEALVRDELAILSNCFLIGDKRKYLSILVTIKTKMDPETGAPLDELHPETILWIDKLDLPYKTLKEILDAGPCPKVMEEIRLAVNRANKHAISNAQKVQKFAILPHDFSIPTGELGPTLKVKRMEVAKMYADTIEGLYKEL